MRNKLVLTITAIFCSSLHGAEGEYAAPRTGYGHPDLQGIWSIATQTNGDYILRLTGSEISA